MAISARARCARSLYDYDITPPETRNYAIERYNYHILLRELGHTLGFSHTGDFTGMTYLEKAGYFQDNNAYSMMSYLLPYITDFFVGLDDIDLRTIDSSSRNLGNNAFKFIGTAVFHKQAGELRYVISDKAGTAADRTYVLGEVNGDGAADFIVSLKGLKHLAASDFIL